MCTSTFVDGHVPPKLPGELTRVGFEIERCTTVPMIRAGYLRSEAGPSFIGNWAFKVVPEKAKGHLDIDHDEVAAVSCHGERAVPGSPLLQKKTRTNLAAPIRLCAWV